jgi:branched-chain amino acid transport system substrate-binding protein
MKEGAMKRLVVLASAVLLGLVDLTGGGPAPAQAQEPIRIGVIYGLGGAAAPYTKPALVGHEIALEEINKTGILGRKLQYVIRDDQSKPDVGVREARDLILKEKVDFLMGVIHSGVALGISEVAKEYKKIYLNTIAKTAALTEEKGHRYVFRSSSNTLIEGRAAAILMADKPFKRYAVIGPDYEYGHRMVDDFMSYLKKLKPDVQVVGEAWPKFGERDFTPHVNALLQAKPEMVYSSLWGGDAIAFVKQAKPYGFFQQTQYMNIAGGDLDVVVPLGAEAPEGLWVSSNYAFYNPDTPANRAFVAKYKAKTGDLPPAGAFFGYVGTYFLAEAVKKAKSVDTEKVIDALEGLTIETPLGPLTMRGYDHQASKGQYWGRLKKVPEYPFPIMGDVQYIVGEKTLRSVDEIKAMRGAK